MGWKEERDALIAQTLAFVEQVTGKPADFSKLAPAPAAAALSGAHGPRPSAMSNAAPAVANDSRPALAATASDELERDIALAVRSIEPTATGTSETASGSSVQAAAEEQPGRAEDEASPANSFRAEPFKSAVSPALAAQLGMQRDMQDEIRARVAKFRAHQERFNRERQEYFSSTLARLRASMEQTSRDDK